MTDNNNPKSSYAIPPSKGQSRVRVNFNVSSSSLIDDIKKKAADLIDMVEGIGGNNPIDSELVRLKSLAQTSFEEAAMWAVKAATFAK